MSDVALRNFGAGLFEYIAYKIGCFVKSPQVRFLRRIFFTPLPHFVKFRDLGFKRSDALAFRLKLLVASGLAPVLAHCASCGERDHLSGFSGAAGGVVCSACEASAFALDEEAHGFLVDALGRPLAQAPDASERALRQAERAIGETAEHHAHVHLRAAA